MPVPVTIHLEFPLLAALDKLVQQTTHTRDWHIAQAIEQYLNLNTWQIAKIEAGIAAANRGDFATDEEMERVWQKFR